MKKIIKDALNTLKYLLVSFVISTIFVIIIYLTLSANEIQRLHYLYSNFIVFYYLIIKLNIVIFALLPISLMVTAFISFNYAASRESSAIGASIGLIFFCIIIFGVLYITLFQEPTRIKIISKIYQPKTSESIPFIYNNGIVTYQDYQFYFENRKAYYFEHDDFVISDIKIDLKKNTLTINKLNKGLGKDFKYLNEIGQIQSLIFLAPFINQVISNFNEMVELLLKNKNFYFLVYLISFLFVICWIPYLLHSEKWGFPYYILSSILIVIFAVIFLSTFKFAISYLKELKIPKNYIYFFPAILFLIIFLFEALLIYIKYTRKVFHSKIQQTKKMQFTKRA